MVYLTFPLECKIGFLKHSTAKTELIFPPQTSPPADSSISVNGYPSFQNPVAQAKILVVKLGSLHVPCPTSHQVLMVLSSKKNLITTSTAFTLVHIISCLDDQNSILKGLPAAAHLL